MQQRADLEQRADSRHTARKQLAESRQQRSDRSKSTRADSKRAERRKQRRKQNGVLVWAWKVTALHETIMKTWLQTG